VQSIFYVIAFLIVFFIVCGFIGLLKNFIRNFEEMHRRTGREPENLISIVTGDLGSGKTLYCTMVSLKNMEINDFEKVGLNYPIRHPEKGFAYHVERENLRDSQHPVCNTMLVFDEAYELWRAETIYSDVDVKEQRFFRTLRHMGNQVFLIYQNAQSCPPWLRRICRDFVWVNSWKLLGRIMVMFVYHWKTEQGCNAHDISSCRVKEFYINWPWYNRFTRAFEAYDTHYYKSKLIKNLEKMGDGFVPADLSRWGDDDNTSDKVPTDATDEPKG